MDTKTSREEGLARACAALVRNGFDVHVFDTPREAVDGVMRQLSGAVSISRGGSATLDEIGLISAIRSRGFPFRDYVSPEDRRASVSAEVYLSGTNAITEDGALVNMDGAGNRVAALCYGPSRVIVVAGVNKVVPTLTDAEARIRQEAAPRNARRLKKDTPCVVTGTCSNCNSPERICRKLVVHLKSEPGRVSVYLIRGTYGF